jgi:hypothetical protein
MKYPTDAVVQYTNDQEYRVCIRNVFSMHSLHVAPLPNGAGNGAGAGAGAGHDDDGDLDEVTRDEWDYDADAMSTGMDWIYDTTASHPLFQEWYRAAAGKMLSEDSSIGVAVLFSYDYFRLFHPCLCQYLIHGDVKEDDACAVNLHKAIV